MKIEEIAVLGFTKDGKCYQVSLSADQTKHLMNEVRTYFEDGNIQLRGQRLSITLTDTTQTDGINN